MRRRSFADRVDVSKRLTAARVIACNCAAPIARDTRHRVSNFAAARTDQTVLVPRGRRPERQAAYAAPDQDAASSASSAASHSASAAAASFLIAASRALAAAISALRVGT